MDLIYMFVGRHPQLKVLLKKAHIKGAPGQFIKKILKLSFYASIAITFLCFLLFTKIKFPLYFLPLVLLGSFCIILFLLIQSPKVIIKRREREIDSEVLFAGRYILVKVESGTPLFNALIDASKSYGVSAKYFKEIVDDINTGMPIEEALETAREYSCSEKFKLILSELVTSLKTGVDISRPLKAVLQQITNKQLIEIKEYGKKLNAFIMLYMVIGTIVPSLGMTMFIIIAAFMSLELPNIIIFAAIVVLVFVQFMFLSLFRMIRPTVNI